MLTTNQSFVIYQGNGLTTQFPYNFVIPNVSNLVVMITNNLVSPPQMTLLTSSQYTASGIGNAGGGVVTYPANGTPLPIGWSITIQRIVPYQQLTSLQNQGAFYPQVVEQCLDLLTMMVQQLAAAIAAGVAINLASTSVFLIDQANGGTYQVVCANGQLGAEPVA
jgi:hypothetical protein